MERITNETKVLVRFNKTQGIQVSTSIPIFDHLLTQMAKCGDFTLEVNATGDNWHHIVEDVGIVLGSTIGTIKPVQRFSQSFIPMDDALALVCVDFSGRGYPVIQLPNGEVDGLDFALIEHFLESLSRKGEFNLHVIVLYGKDNHHIAEAVFKALGKTIGNTISG